MTESIRQTPVELYQRFLRLDQERLDLSVKITATLFSESPDADDRLSNLVEDARRLRKEMVEIKKILSNL